MLVEYIHLLSESVEDVNSVVCVLFNPDMTAPLGSSSPQVAVAKSIKTKCTP